MTGQQDAGHGREFTADQIQHMVDTAVNPFVVIDSFGTAVWASASVVELLGITAQELVGRSMLDLVAPASVDAAVEALANASEQDRRPGAAPAAWEGVGPVLELRRADGTITSCAIAVATPARTGLPYFVLQLRRADAAHALETALRAMAASRPVGEVLNEVAAVLRGELPDADVIILYDRRGDGRLTPVSEAEGVWGDLALPAAAGDAWDKALANPGTVIERPIDALPDELRRASETRGYRWLTLLAVAPMVEDDPTIRAVVSVWSRSTFPMHFLNYERVERCGSLMTMALRWESGRRGLQWAATHDGLTGLHNRSAFLSTLRAAGGAGRRATDRTAVLYLDLDDFKPVNDLHGHTLGDQVLVEVARRLRAAVRPADVVARLGGDEFAVLCPGLADLQGVEQLAGRLVAVVREPIEVDGVQVQIGLSVGIAILDDDVDDVERVLDRADTALRAAKEDGKSRWQVA